MSGKVTYAITGVTIKDLYHEDTLLNNNINNTKITLYKALSRCRSNLIILCPISKKNYIKKMLKNIKNIKLQTKF